MKNGGTDPGLFEVVSRAACGLDLSVSGSSQGNIVFPWF